MIAETIWDLPRLLLGRDAARSNSVSPVARQCLHGVPVVTVHKERSR